jgi:hypothetical protein
MHGQYIPTTLVPSLDMLHQTTGDWLIFLQSTSVFLVNYHPTNAPYSFIYHPGDGQRAIRGHISTNEYSHPTTRIKSVITTYFNCRYIFSVEVADHGCWMPMYPAGVSLKNEPGFRKHRFRRNTVYVTMLHDPTNSSWYLTNMLLTTVDNFRYTFRYTKLYINKIWYNRNLSKLSCPYPCTDITSLCKNPTNALIYFNTNLFTLLQS